jgi:hypothetical protein
MPPVLADPAAIAVVVYRKAAAALPSIVSDLAGILGMAAPPIGGASPLSGDRL